MKSPFEKLPQLYTTWMNGWWTMMTGRLDHKELHPGAVQKAADKKWEGEGGSIKPPTKQ